MPCLSALPGSQRLSADPLRYFPRERVRWSLFRHREWLEHCSQSTPLCPRFPPVYGVQRQKNSGHAGVDQGDSGCFLMKRERLNGQCLISVLCSTAGLRLTGGLVLSSFTPNPSRYHVSLAPIRRTTVSYRTSTPPRPSLSCHSLVAGLSDTLTPLCPQFRERSEG